MDRHDVGWPSLSLFGWKTKPIEAYFIVYFIYLSYLLFLFFTLILFVHLIRITVVILTLRRKDMHNKLYESTFSCEGTFNAV
jgi:uncharacterized membrane protein YcgQ (UPF0703/DUF1980 family)